MVLFFKYIMQFILCTSKIHISIFSLNNNKKSLFISIQKGSVKVHVKIVGFSTSTRLNTTALRIRLSQFFKAKQTVIVEDKLV